VGRGSFRGARPTQAEVQVGVICIAAVRDRQSNTLLFSASAALFSASNSADGRHVRIGDSIEFVYSKISVTQMISTINVQVTAIHVCTKHKLCNSHRA
jgi:hypothetical protein